MEHGSNPKDDLNDADRVSLYDSLLLSQATGASVSPCSMLSFIPGTSTDRDLREAGIKGDLHLRL